MKSPNRDLLVLLKDEFMSEHAIEREVARLNEMLFDVESFDNISVSHELIDLNKYRIYHEQKTCTPGHEGERIEAFCFSVQYELILINIQKTPLLRGFLIYLHF